MMMMMMMMMMPLVCEDDYLDNQYINEAKHVYHVVDFWMSFLVAFGWLPILAFLDGLSQQDFAVGPLFGLLVPLCWHSWRASGVSAMAC